MDLGISGLLLYLVAIIGDKMNSVELPKELQNSARGLVIGLLSALALACIHWYCLRRLVLTSANVDSSKKSKGIVHAISPIVLVPLVSVGIAWLVNGSLLTAAGAAIAVMCGYLSLTSLLRVDKHH
jgi:hypothetical protein